MLGQNAMEASSYFSPDRHGVCLASAAWLPLFSVSRSGPILLAMTLRRAERGRTIEGGIIGDAEPLLDVFITNAI